MVSVSAHNTFGTSVLFCASTVSTNGVPIMGLLSIAPPKMSKNVIDVTNFGTTDGYSQVVPGTLTRSSPITLSAIYITTSSMMCTVILNAYENRLKSSLVITIPGWYSTATNTWSTDRRQIVSEGYVTDYDVLTPFDDKVTFNMSFKPTGKPLIQAPSTLYSTST